MWTCSKCSNEVDEQFDNCPQCGTGRDGSEPPVDFVKKGEAYQPKLPAGEIDPKRKNRLAAILIVVAAILVLLLVALGKHR